MAARTESAPILLQKPGHPLIPPDPKKAAATVIDGQPFTAPPDPVSEPKGKPRGPYQKRREKEPGGQLYAPGLPTNGLDLMAVWQLPRAAYEGGRLKITRRKYASLELEIVAESDVASYNLMSLAREYGAGDYFLYLSPDNTGQWPVRNAKVSVSPQYAANAGYQVYTSQPNQMNMLPRISEARALQATAGAMQSGQPLTVADLAQLVEMVADKTAAAIRAANPPAPPMGMDAMLTLWRTLTELQNSAEERTLKLAARFQEGGHLVETVPPPEPTFMEGVLKALPAIIQMFIPTPGKPAPTQPVPVASVVPKVEMGQPGQPGQSEDTSAPGQPETEPKPMPINPVVPLTEAEQHHFASSIYMLRPFVPLILQAFASGRSMPELAKEFEGYIPWRLEGEIVELAKLVNERGNMVLAMISPQLATDQVAQLVAELAVILQAEETDG